MRRDNKYRTDAVTQGQKALGMLSGVAIVLIIGLVVVILAQIG